MKPSEIFRIKLKRDLEKQGRGAQVKLAKKTGIGVKHLNDFLGGRAPLSEEKRVAIAEALGYSYVGYLAEEKHDSDEKETNPELQKAIDDLRAIYESNDPMLIGAIRSNLTEFRRAADDRKKHEEEMVLMKKQMQEMQAQIKALSKPKQERTPTKQPNGLVYDRRKTEIGEKKKN